jgi:membrane-associated protein
MELLVTCFDVFLHLDRYLHVIITHYGFWSYFILFTIVFCETGLVMTPFLPGDSLLFAAGAFAALGLLQVEPLLAVVALAAISGDTANYWIGNYVGPRAFSGKVRFLKQDYLDRTHRFYAKHGGKTIILARFIPIIRTFAPFVAGIGTMAYGRFITYNIIGGVLWVAIFILGGYFFGRLPLVQANFTYVILAIIAISLVPIGIEFVQHRCRHGRRLAQ